MILIPTAATVCVAVPPSATLNARNNDFTGDVFDNFNLRIGLSSHVCWQMCHLARLPKKDETNVESILGEHSKRWSNIKLTQHVGD